MMWAQWCITHAPYATVLSMLRRPIPASHYMIAALLWLAGELETLARVHYLASLAGAPVLLPEEETLALCARFTSYRPGSKGNR